MKKQLPFLLLLFMPMLAIGQSANISGTIKDAETGEGLLGATIQAIHTPSSTTYGSTADMDGNYKIEGLRPGDGYRIRVSYTGFEALVQERITLSEGQNFKFDAQLSAQSTSLKEVAVVGSRFNKPRTNIDRPVPIDVISPKEIQATSRFRAVHTLHRSVL